MNLSCDIFCRVIDNYGDAATSWRLARQLARQYGWRVRLYIDDLKPLAQLNPTLHLHAVEQTLEAVVVSNWPAEGQYKGFVADVVIEAFACTLPHAYLCAMAAQPTSPVWLNLEYFTAEDWALACHLQPSPHPHLPLMKYFFFPGIRAGMGGLLHDAQRELVTDTPEGMVTEWNTDDALEISLFCYDNAALPQLLSAWAEGGQRIRCYVCAGYAQSQVAAYLGRPWIAGAASVELGNLQLIALPFLPQADYDRLLSRCSLNFVRGEDSLTQAQWAEQPLVWQIYPQSDAAHRLKLEAFLAAYCQPLAAQDEQAATILCRFWRVWNGDSANALPWQEFCAALPTLRQHARSWAQQLHTLGDVAGNVVAWVHLQRQRHDSH